MADNQQKWRCSSCGFKTALPIWHDPSPNCERLLSNETGTYTCGAPLFVDNQQDARSEGAEMCHMCGGIENLTRDVSGAYWCRSIGGCSARRANGGSHPESFPPTPSPEHEGVRDASAYEYKFKHLQPAQYASLLRKAEDPNHYEHRYVRDDAKERARISLTRELRDVLKELLAAIREREALTKLRAAEGELEAVKGEVKECRTL